MNDQADLHIQEIELRDLLETAGDDPVMAPQLRVRLAEVEKQLATEGREFGTLLPKEDVVLPRAAIFLRGGGVQDSKGIRPSLAGEALIQYERMFTEQALHDEREAARNAGRQRRPRGAATPGLLFTGTPRGSFGLEFVPQPTDDPALLGVHAQSLHNIAKALALVADSDANSLDETVKAIPSRVLQPLKQFMTTLANYGAELRLAFSEGPSRSVSHDKLRVAADRLEREVAQDIVKVTGEFRGVARESGVFDLKPDNGEVISGTVADHFTEEDLEALHQLTTKHCVAELQATTVNKITGPAKPTYVLLAAHEVKRQIKSK